MSKTKIVQVKYSINGASEQHENCQCDSDEEVKHVIRDFRFKYNEMKGCKFQILFNDKVVYP